MAEETKNEIVIVSEETIRDKIYEIRGQKVMISTDLAEIYGYTISAFNQQVKNNRHKFAEDFRFQLTNEEWRNLKSKNLISSWGGSRKPPYAFTEQGIYMLMTVLRGELATKQSIALIRLFKSMKDYLVNTPLLISQEDAISLALQTSANTREIQKIKDEMATKDDLAKFMRNFTSEHIGKELLFMDGKTVEADVAYAEIYDRAKKTIFIVDNYIGIKTLLLLRNVPKTVKITIFTDNVGNGKLTKSEYEDFKKEYPETDIVFRKTNGKFHDRFIVLDYKTRTEKIYHCGSSSKDAGKRTTAITQSSCKDLYHPMVEGLLHNEDLILK